MPVSSRWIEKSLCLGRPITHTSGLHRGFRMALHLEHVPRVDRTVQRNLCQALHQDAQRLLFVFPLRHHCSRRHGRAERSLNRVVWIG